MKKGVLIRSRAVGSPGTRVLGKKKRQTVRLLTRHRVASRGCSKTSAQKQLTRTNGVPVQCVEREFQ
ncbi:MAG: hypothetical protein I8H75_06225 [Myxococcaceae bacterium]|nr:hypothetical protein [Myxococcaceae bacterium]